MFLNGTVVFTLLLTYQSCHDVLSVGGNCSRCDSSVLLIYYSK